MSWSLALALAYVGLGAIALCLFLSSRFSVAVKTGIIGALSLFYIISYIGANELRGWAIQKPPPNPFKLHWAVVEEPDKAQGLEGRIFLLAQALGDYGELRNAPRLYELPFSAALAQEVSEAKKRIEEGKTVEGNLSYKAVRPEEDEERETRRDAGDNRAADGEQERLILDFRDLPRPELPPKS
jgi:hypothetical protein